MVEKKIYGTEEEKRRRQQEVSRVSFHHDL